METQRLSPPPKGLRRKALTPSLHSIVSGSLHTCPFSSRHEGCRPLCAAVQLSERQRHGPLAGDQAGSSGRRQVHGQELQSICVEVGILFTVVGFRNHFCNATVSCFFVPKLIYRTPTDTFPQAAPKFDVTFRRPIFDATDRPVSEAVAGKEGTDITAAIQHWLSTPGHPLVTIEVG